MSQSRFVGEPHEEQVVTPAEGYNPGDVVLAPSGRPGYIVSQRPLEEGEPATIRTTGLSDVAAASATLFDAGVLVGWDDTAKLAVAAASGDFVIGTAAREKVDGETTVKVIWNDPIAQIADLQAQIDAL